MIAVDRSEDVELGKGSPEELLGPEQVAEEATRGDLCLLLLLLLETSPSALGLAKQQVDFGQPLVL